MIQAWAKLIVICEERKVDPSLIVWPKKHKEGWECAERARVLKAMRKRGLNAAAIAKLCPLDIQRIRAIVRNGL